MRRLTRDGTAEPVSRDQILRRESGQGNIHFSCSADHVQGWQPYPVDSYSCYMCIIHFIQQLTCLQKLLGWCTKSHAAFRHQGLTCLLFLLTDSKILEKTLYPDDPIRAVVLIREQVNYEISVYVSENFIVFTTTAMFEKLIVLHYHGCPVSKTIPTSKRDKTSRDALNHTCLGTTDNII